MKKIISFLVVLTIMLALAACGTNPTTTVPMGTNPDGEVQQETFYEEVDEPVHLRITTPEGEVLLETTAGHLDFEDAIENAMLVEMETGETVHVLIGCHECGYAVEFYAGVPWALLYLCECIPTNYVGVVFGNEETFKQATEKITA